MFWTRAIRLILVETDSINYIVSVPLSDPLLGCFWFFCKPAPFFLMVLEITGIFLSITKELVQ